MPQQLRGSAPKVFEVRGEAYLDKGGFKKLNEEGTTIVQVTHSEVNASYGTRIIQLRDGWVVDEEAQSAVGSRAADR